MCSSRRLKPRAISYPVQYRPFRYPIGAAFGSGKSGIQKQQLKKQNSSKSNDFEEFWCAVMDFSPPGLLVHDCLKGKSGPFRFPRSFAGAEMGPGEEKPAGHTLVWPRVLTKHGHISARQNRVCPCPSMLVSVHAKDCVDYQCRRCGQCCRHIKDAVMVESMDAYRLANYLRGCDPNICTIDDVLTRYCKPMPLTQECFPIFMLKTTGPDDSCIFLKDGLCSIYEARPRTCRLYPFSVGPGERGRDFEYCLCFDHNQQYHFNGGKVSVKDWFYRNFPRMEKEYLKQEYAAITEIGKRMRSISPELCKQMTFQVLFYRYYNFDLDQPFLEQYAQNTRLLLEKLRQFEVER